MSANNHKNYNHVNCVCILKSATYAFGIFNICAYMYLIVSIGIANPIPADAPVGE